MRNDSFYFFGHLRLEFELLWKWRSAPDRLADVEGGERLELVRLA